MKSSILLVPHMKFMKTLNKFRVDWLLLIFFLLLLLLPFVVFSNKASQNTTITPMLPGGGAPEIIFTSASDTLEEDFPAVFTLVTIALATIPTDTVYIVVQPNDQVNAGAGAGVNDTLMFTPYAAALIPKEVKIKPIDDAVFEGDHYGFVAFSVISEAPEYIDMVLSDVSYLIKDNDLPPGINSVIPTDTFFTEGLAGVDLLFSMTSIPADIVLITIDPDDQLRITGVPGEPVTLLFEANASALSFDGVSIRAVDDAIYEGTHTGTITFTITSDDPTYAAFTIADVTYNIEDNDNMPGLVYTAPIAPELTEGIGEVPVVIALNSIPTDTVYIEVQPDDQLRITGAPAEPITLVFAPNSSALNDHIANVKAYDDAIFEGDHDGDVLFSITSADLTYNGLLIEPLTITIQDNDLAPGIVFLDTAGLAGTEGVIDSFPIQLYLLSIPEFTVTINLDPDVELDLGKGKDADLSLKFKDDSALIAKTVYVKIFDDPFGEDFHTGIITCSITTDDLVYAAYTIPDILVQITDNDELSISTQDATFFEVFPSNNNGIMQFNLADGFHSPEMRVLNTTGSVVYQSRLTSTSGQLDLSMLSAGTYIIMVSENNFHYYQRIQIMH